MDEYVWVDDGGSQTGTDSDLRMFDHLAGGAWETLGELDRMLAADRAAKKGAKMSPADYHRTINSYIGLNVRLGMKLTFHVHWTSDPSGVWPGPVVPRHCGWPMWLRPSGFHCRQCDFRAAFPVDIA